jgi:hypothetical protein
MYFQFIYIFQAADNEVIDLDDEEEIDDVEKEDKTKEVIDLETPKKTAAAAAEKGDSIEASGSKKRSLEMEEGEEGGEANKSKKTKGEDDNGGD